MVARISVAFLRGTIVCVFSFAALIVSAADKVPEPILRIDTGGHSSFVTSLAWHPNGRQLWSAGWDKIVRVWELDETGKFVAKPEKSIRVPIGPGPNGKIDSIALSSDGRWLAIGGYASLAKRAASFRDQGVETAISSIELLEQGAIYVLDRNTNSMRRLEGHRGPVRRLSFAKAPNDSEHLISAGFDLDANQTTIGSLRVWDVAAGKQIDGILLPETPSNRPAVVAIGKSPGSAHQSVLAAWGNGRLFHWEPLKPPQYRTYADGRFNNSIVADPEGKWVITASADDASSEGLLTYWNIDSNGIPTKDSRRQVRFPSQGSEIYMPLGVTLASRPDGNSKLSAIVLCVFRDSSTGTPAPDRFQLRLMSAPDGNGSSREIFRKDLWRVDSKELRVPELASTANGQHLAIAGNPNHEIQIYKISELLQGQSQPQRLGGDSITPQQIEFVDRQGQLGLSVLERAYNDAAHSPKFVFDLLANRIDAPETLGWSPSKPSPQGWTLSRSSADPLRLDVIQQGAVRTTVRLPRRHLFSSYAFTAPLNQTGSPLLVVAAHEEGQPWIGVFNVKDGSLNRVFRAHTEPIESLAISGDSRLLASASNDQTIAVWDLSDVDTILTARATLAGVGLVAANQVVRVDKILEGAPAAAQLKTGDQLLGLIDTARSSVLHPWRTVDDLNASLRDLPTGAKATIRRQRGTEVADVQIVLQQAADERKPLFQLMIARKDATAPRRWIGWSPLGPFDASDREIQQHLGWHFNEYKPDAPVAFAPVDQYPYLLQPGLIGEKIKNRGLPIQKPPVALIDPRMKLEVLEPEVRHWSETRTALLRKPPQSVSVQIGNADFAVETVQSIRLLVDGEEGASFTPSSNDRWRVDDLQLAEMTRGLHKIQAILETRGIPAKSFSTEERINFIPPAPTLELKQAPPSITKERQLSVAAFAKLGHPGVPFDVTLDRVKAGEARETVKTWKSDDRGDAKLDIEFPLDLIEGENHFSLSAQNREATQATKELETAIVRVDLIRSPRDKNPPAIEVLSMEQLVGIAAESVAYKPNGQMTVLSESVRIGGTIRATENLTLASADGTSLPGFRANSSGDFKFQFPIKLKPGPNTIRLAAKTETSPEASLELNVLFRQPLPDVDFAEPIAGQVIDALVPTSTIRLSALFQPSPLNRPIAALAAANGKRIEKPLVVDAQAGTIRGEVPLALGENTYLLQLSNDTGAEEQTRPLIVHYQPIPVVEHRQVPAEIDGSTLDARLSGVSVSPIHRILMDGRELLPAQWKGEQDGIKFTLQLTAIPWQADRRQFALAIFAKGVDKPALELLDTPRRKVPARPPTLTFLSPSDDAPVPSESVTVEFQVSSRTQLTNVELLHDSQRILQPRLEPARAGVDSNFRFQATARLRPGVNELKLLAENKDGLRAETLVLNYVPSPVELRLDSIASVDSPAAGRPVSMQPDGTWGLGAPVESSRNVLTGRVRWNYRDEIKLKDKQLQVWIAVNGFKQPIRLQLPAESDSLERTFSCQLHFFRPQGNVVEVSVPDLAELATTRKVMEVDCKSPEVPRQRLHLVIVGVGVKRDEETSLMREAVATLSGTELHGVERRKEFVFKSPAFAECVGYGPYTGPVVSREKIGTLLEMIRIKLHQAHAIDPANDVMLMYYRGGEQVYDGGQFYLTTREAQNAKDAELLRNPLQLQYFAVSSNFLSNFVNRCPGVQLLLLDVARNALDAKLAARSPDFIPGAATFRYAWLKGAVVPSDARLIAAWRTASPATKLEQIESSLSVQHVNLTKRYQNSVSYENHLPPVLRDLTIASVK